MKKWARYFLISCVLLQCGNLDRNNPLDPKNPTSSVARAILAEIFVNDSTGYQFCDYALEALTKLSQQAEYAGKLYVLEYHLVNKASNWDDQYSLEECNQRYYDYVPLSTERGIPDAMFNGLVKREQGASSENIQNRYLTAVQSLLGQKGYFRIEGTKNISLNSIKFDISIARYSTSWEGDIDVNVVMYEDLKLARHHYVVRKIFQSQKLTVLKRGEIKAFTFIAPLPQYQRLEDLYALVFLQDRHGPTREVYQVAKF